MAKGAVWFVGAVSWCYLGLLTAWLLWRLPSLPALFGADTQVAGRGVRGLLPDFRVSGVAEESLVRILIENAGPFALALGVVAAGVHFGPKLRRWNRLFLTFVVFWAGLFLIDAALGFAQGFSGPLTTILRLAAVADFAEPVFGILLAGAATVLVIAASARLIGGWHFEDFAILRGRLACGILLFVAPVAALNLYQGRAPFGVGFWRLDLPYAPVLLAAAALTAALWRPRAAETSLRLGPAEGMAAICCAVLAYAGVGHLSRIEPRPPAEAHFDESQSRYWNPRFEQGAFTPEQRRRWGEGADQRLERLAARLDVPVTEGNRLVYIHMTADSKRTVAPERSTDSPALIDPTTGALHHLLSVNGSPADPRGEAHVLLRQVWGEPRSRDVAQAIARYAAGRYLDADLSEYARRITCEERHYALSEIFALDGEYISPIVRDVLSGAWVGSVAEAAKQPMLRGIYQAPLLAGSEDAFAGTLGKTWAELERDWKTYIDSLPCPSHVKRQITLHHNHRGITFTHEFRNGWGYGSDMAGEQLQRIRGFGGIAIALVPYASFSTPPSTDFRFRLSESDERIVRSIEQARAAGLQVMLKPQLWGRIFTGEIAYERPEDFESWFERYRQWILHFARMAELHGVELFCIGNELNGVTVHERHWRGLIRDIRRVYSGPLTFAANWNEEFEQIAFWDALDYLGVNFYFPLAEQGELPAAGSPRLQEITLLLEAMHRRFDKPILFTEVGYPPLATAAAEPWKETNAAFDEALQKRCYETVFEAFSRKPWFAGMYWWKWPSHGQGSAFEIGHNPIGKPALDVLHEWYGKPWQ